MRTPRLSFLRPKSLMGQMLLAVAAALLLVQGIGAILVYRAQRESYEVGMVNAAAFRLIAETRGRGGVGHIGRHDRSPFAGPPLRGFPLQTSNASPANPGEPRDNRAEARLQRILTEQEFPSSGIVVVHRTVQGDPVGHDNTMKWAAHRGKDERQIADRMDDHLLVVGVKQPAGGGWTIVRVRSPRDANMLVQPLIVQTLIIYLVLVGAVALILRRITRPLAALRVRIESVEDDNERGRMARTIEDIVRTLDDILSLARVGRPSDPRERTELSALVASVVEEYEDMGEPVELGDTQRIVLELRSTWMRRALRNLIGNALRYGQRARVTLVREGSSAVILIEDDGPGIPDDTIEDMMNPFVRGDPSRNSTTGGAGLGLALARAIADQHGGALILANRLSAAGTVEGLTARLEIPVG